MSPLHMTRQKYHTLRHYFRRPLQSGGGAETQSTAVAKAQRGDQGLSIRIAGHLWKGWEGWWDTTAFGPSINFNLEEVFIVSGCLVEALSDCWQEAGDYASQPAGEAHGPFHSEEAVLFWTDRLPNSAMIRPRELPQ
jgi:hypothetical protein